MVGGAPRVCSAMNPKGCYQFGYCRSPDQDSPWRVHRPVVVIGAGPVGLTVALDLGRRKIPVVLLDDADRIGAGSRAICFAKRTLEIFDRLGVAGPMLAKGVVWKKGRVFLDKSQIYEFDLLPEGGHRMPAFVNLQQYYVEQFLIEASETQLGIDLRWRNKVVGIEPRADGATISIETPEGDYQLACDWVVCCDGARSPSRGMLGLDFQGEVFEDQFLIADVKMRGSYPTERWFWFDPPFHSGQSALLHRQPMISGASICNSAPARMPKTNASPSVCSHELSACSDIGILRSSGYPCISSSADGWRRSCTAP